MKPFAHKTLEVPSNIPEFTGKLKGRPVRLGSRRDKGTILKIAGFILHHIEEHFLEPEKQGYAFYDCDWRGTTSPSKWTLKTVCALNIFFQPLDDLNQVLPVETEPSVAEMKDYAGLLSESLDRAFFSDHSKWGPTLEAHPSLKAFMVDLHLVLLEQQMQGHTTPNDRVQRMVCSLMSYLDIGNPLKTRLILGGEISLFSNLGSIEYASSVEFGFTLRKYFDTHCPPGFVYVQVEERSSKAPEAVVAQHIAECLAFAVANFSTREPDDQEVFGIYVSHNFFSFWHAVYPKKYLSTLRVNPAKLGESYGLTKCYPASNYGLDVCDPHQRWVITRAILRIMKYVEQIYK